MTENIEINLACYIHLQQCYSVCYSLCIFTPGMSYYDYFLQNLEAEV
jgi:hypothetical protein